MSTPGYIFFVDEDNLERSMWLHASHDAFRRDMVADLRRLPEWYFARMLLQHKLSLEGEGVAFDHARANKWGPIGPAFGFLMLTLRGEVSEPARREHVEHTTRSFLSTYARCDAYSLAALWVQRYFSRWVPIRHEDAHDEARLVVTCHLDRFEVRDREAKKRFEVRWLDDLVSACLRLYDEHHPQPQPALKDIKP